MSLKQLYCFLLLTFLSILASAEVVGDLYQISRPVLDRSIVERDLQFTESLRAVLIKATGGQIDFDIPIIQAAMNKPSRFVLQWTYHKKLIKLNGQENEQAAEELEEMKVALNENEASLNENETELNENKLSATLDDATELQVSFDPQAIQWLLEEAHVRSWGNLRPLCLFWLAKAEGYSRFILTDNNPETLALKEAANAIALPIMFPMMDLKEQTEVNVADVWGLFEPALIDISKTYQADLVVMGRMYKDGEKVKGEFSLMKPYEHKWQLQADSDAALLNAFVYDFTKYVLEKYSGKANAALQNMLLTVTGIEDSNQVTQLENYFKKLPSVHNTTILGLEGSRVSFKLQVQGSEEALSRLIQLDPDGHLALHSLNPETHILSFNWQK